MLLSLNFLMGHFSSYSQQLQAVHVRTDKWQVHWHPLIIKWCLHLKMLSPVAYHALRTSGFLALPSERTVRGAADIQSDVKEQLIKEAKVTILQDYEKFVVVAVKIREDLVYDEHMGQVVGFVNFSDFNNQLHALTEACESCTTFKPDTVATHVLVFMVLGLFTNIEYTYAQFTTTTAPGVQLFSVVWDVV